MRDYNEQHKDEMADLHKKTKEVKRQVQANKRRAKGYFSRKMEHDKVEDDHELLDKMFLL